MCRNQGFNEVIMPNILGHETQEEAELELQTFFPLVQSRCSRHLKYFLCYVYASPCTSLSSSFPPCKSLCLLVRSDCRQLMQNWKFQWPADLSCDKFPVEVEAVCFKGRDFSTTLKPTPGKFAFTPNLNKMYTGEVVRFGSMIIFHLRKLRKSPESSSYCVM